MTQKDDSPSARASRLSAEIADQEGRLAALNRERDQLQQRLDKLRAELSALECQSIVPDDVVASARQALPLKPAQKVALFRSLFRGRDDVYPKRWENARTGKTGYAPACANEWVRGVCEKPRVKCGECPNQAFLPVTDQVILDHLLGRHVIGAYPLLENEVCWFLAIDFDKCSWAKDVSAFAGTCGRAGVPVAVERSRSKGTLVQYAGRLHRTHPDKREVRIFDYADREVPMLMRMFDKRLRGYRAMGYESGDLPRRYEQAITDPVIEWDEGAVAPS